MKTIYLALLADDIIRNADQFIENGSNNHFYGDINWIEKSNLVEAQCIFGDSTSGKAPSCLLIFTDIIPQKIPVRQHAETAPIIIYANHQGEIIAFYDGMRIDSIVIKGSLYDKINFFDQYTLNMNEFDLIRHSRSVTIFGQERLELMKDIPFLLIGAGRNGSSMAKGLAHLGVENITIADGDHYELSNFNGGELFAIDDMGKNKAGALLNQYQKCIGKSCGSAIKEYADSRNVRSAALEAEIIICCVDDDFSRLLMTFVASCYSKVLLDVGSGVFLDDDGEIAMGGDIRLLLPGQHCLWCMGGLHNQDDLLKAATKNWRSRRLGSLHSLNAINVGMGLRLLEDYLLGGVLDSSTWLHVEYENSIPQVTNWSSHVDKNTPCPVCHYQHSGDRGFSEWPLFLNTIQNIFNRG